MDTNGNLYVGGGFTNAGGVAANRIAKWTEDNSGSAGTNLYIDLERVGTIYAIARQADGKVVIGGSFAKVNGQYRNNLARLNADGSVDDTWTTDADSIVTTLAIDGTALYAGGYFLTIGGLARNYIAKLSTTDGSVDTAFTNGTSSSVDALAVSGGSLYIGGWFNIGGHTNIAKLSTTDGSVDSAFANGADSQVLALTVSGGALYAGGWFTRIGGQNRKYIAKLSTTDGSADATFTNAVTDFIGYVNALVVDGSALYAGGYFSTIGGQSRRNIAKLSTTDGSANVTFTGVVSGWNEVRTLAVDGSALYAGGDFTTIGGQARNYIAKLSTTDGSADATFINGANASVRAISAGSSLLYIGGDFTQIGGSNAIALAQADPATGASTNSSIIYDNGTASAMAKQSDGTLFIAGTFAYVNGQPRRNIVKLNPDGSINTAFTNGPNSGVEGMTVDETAVYIGGQFTSVGDQARNRIAKLTTTDGSADATFTNGADNEVRTLAQSGNDLYAGGLFANIGGRAQRSIAKLSTTDGSADAAFTNEAHWDVFALAVDGNALYAGGDFTEIGGKLRNCIAKLSTTDGSADTTFTNGVNSSSPWVPSLAFLDGALYAGGLFTNIGGQARTRIAKLSTTDGSADATFTNGASGVPWAFAISGGMLYVGGGFTNIGGRAQNRIAKLSITDGSANAAFTNNAADGSVSAIVIHGTNCYVGGSFTRFNGVSHLGFASFSLGSPTSSVPSAPTGVSASDGIYTNKVRITWNASSGATGYKIWRNTSDTTNAAGQIGSTTNVLYDDTTATAGTIYYYWLKATNSIGTSSFSSSDSGYRRTLTPGEVAFSASSYTVYENAGNVTLTVTRSLGNDGAASVNYATQDGTARAGTDYTAASGTLSWSDGNAASKTITVTIINRSGRQDNRAFTVNLSGASGVALASPYSTTVTIVDRSPSSPTGVIAGDGTYTNKVMVYWTTLSSATSYKVWRGTSNNAQNASLLGTCTASFYLDTSTTPDILYYYWIQTVYATEISDLSVPDSGYCGTIANLTSPTGIQASKESTDRISVTWQAVSKAIRYEVWRNTENELSAASLISEPTGTSYDDYSVSQGICYYYWLKARTAHRDGNFSASDAGWRRLSTPSGVSASNGLYPYHIGVAWNAVANAAWYEVWREEVPGSNSDGGHLAKVAQTGNVYFNDYYTKSGVYYNYKVKAYNELCSSLDYGQNTGHRQVNASPTSLSAINDYDGDMLSDLALFNPLSGVLDVLCSALGRQTFILGAEHSQGVTGDYDGDRVADPVAYCHGSYTWFVMLSIIDYKPIIQANFGGNGNSPVAADFDGDGLTDIVVYNETDGVLSVILSNGGAFDISVSCLLGGSGYSFVSADFDGDGLADPTVYSESEGRVIIFLSGSGYFSISVALGGQGQAMSAADFDGDRLADPVLYEQAGIWTILLSSAEYSEARLSFGGLGYVPAIGDYDGDGLADPAIYRETDGQWLIMSSASSYSVIAETFGEANFIPFGPVK